MSADGVYDTATLTYRWSVDDAQGSATNYAYPARKHPAFEKVDEVLEHGRLLEQGPCERESSEFGVAVFS